MPRKILIDGDIVAYQHAAKAETPTHWGDDLWTLHADAKECRGHIEHWLKELQSKLDGSEVTIYLSSSDNFRKELVDSSYKANRAGKRKPVILKAIREWMVEELDARSVPSLEADDAIGIEATKKENEGCIIASIDKDFGTVPGSHFNWSKDIGVTSVDEEEADYNFYLQVLTGDATDGYAGCPGIGPKRAERLLEDADDYWSAVVGAYEKAGFGPEYALTQARLARILRATDYNHDQQEVILWNPPQ